jgi:two-component system nitrate/nitrite response regulator NarL
MPAPNNSAETATDTNKDKPPICVLAADSTRMNSQMLADVLARDKRFRVLETQISADNILAFAENEKPDVVLLSPLLDGDPGRGFKLARELRTAIPSIRIVMLLDRSERAIAVEAFRAGASGIFARSESFKFITRCNTCVHAGQVWANSNELKYLLDALAEAVPARPLANKAEFSVLSRREQEVVQGVADGMSNREIANNLGLTEHTVKNYLFRIFDKLGVSSRVEVVLYAFGLSGAAPPHALTMEFRGQPAATTGRARKNPRPTGRETEVAIEKESRKALP